MVKSFMKLNVTYIEFHDTKFYCRNTRCNDLNILLSLFILNSNRYPLITEHLSIE